MTADEKSSWKYGRRLLSFKPGDWVLHKNVPGILITTGERTQNLETAFNNLADAMRKKSNKKVAVYLIAGNDVAKFVLRYGLDLLI